MKLKYQRKRNTKKKKILINVFFGFQFHSTLKLFIRNKSSTITIFTKNAGRK